MGGHAKEEEEGRSGVTHGAGTGRVRAIPMLSRKDPLKGGSERGRGQRNKHNLLLVVCLYGDAWESPKVRGTIIPSTVRTCLLSLGRTS